MDWIYPEYDVVDDTLLEEMSLQRELEKYLLEGKNLRGLGAYIKISCAIANYPI